MGAKTLRIFKKPDYCVFFKELTQNKVKVSLMALDFGQFWSIVGEIRTSSKRLPLFENKEDCSDDQNKTNNIIPSEFFF